MKCIVDVRKMELSLSDKCMREFECYLTDMAIFPGNYHLALLTDTPEQVVMATLFKNIHENELLKVEIFSTYNGASEWLGIVNYQN